MFALDLSAIYIYQVHEKNSYKFQVVFQPLISELLSTGTEVGRTHVKN